MTITKRNIIASALKAFRGDDYAESLYLWLGAKHDRSLTQILADQDSTLQDAFLADEEIQRAHGFCKAFYYRVLPVLAARMNAAHGLEWQVSSWQIVFGYWLFRHISIAYDKFRALCEVDVDHTSIKLLDPRCYHVPSGHFDYLYCFANDFGAQQLVSEYYVLFATKRFQTVEMQFNYDPRMAPRVETLSEKFRGPYLSDVRVALLCTYLSEDHFKALERQSKGRIRKFPLPYWNSPVNPGIDYPKRCALSGVEPKDPFETYFFRSLIHCLPRDFVENFKGYCDRFIPDVDSLPFTHIVSEGWISLIPAAIYIAAAKERGRAFVACEHGSGSFVYDDCLTFIGLDAADTYLTVGSKRPHPKLVQGGFACRPVATHHPELRHDSVLFISHTIFHYTYEFCRWSASNATFIQRMKLVSDVIDALPEALKGKFVFRPREEGVFWDTAHLLEIDTRGVRIDRGTFSESIMCRRIVIIDHISTGIAEILMNGVPFMLVIDPSLLPKGAELQPIFDALRQCGLMHTSARSAVSHLENIYDQVDPWWQSNAVQAAVRRLADYFLAPGERSTRYLLSLLSGDSVKTPQHMFTPDESGVHRPPKGLSHFDYSDGAESEECIRRTLESARDISTDSEELRRSIRDWVSEYHFSRERHNLLRHLTIDASFKVLELGCGCGALTRQLGERQALVVAVEGSYRRAQAAAARSRDLRNVKVLCAPFQDIDFTDRFDLVTLIGVLEYSPSYFPGEDPIRQCLETAKRALAPGGTLVIAIENQLGLKYLCGYPEDHTGEPFLGVEDRYAPLTVTTFGRTELKRKLTEAGLAHVEFHYPFPDYKTPRAVFTEAAFRSSGFRPGEIIRQLRSRDHSGTAVPTLREELTLPVISRNGLVPDLSNSFLVLASAREDAFDRLRDSRQLGRVYTTDRRPAYNVQTDFSVHDDVIVVRKETLGRPAPTVSGGVLVHTPGEEAYVAGACLESEYRRCLLTRGIPRLRSLFESHARFLSQESVPAGATSTRDPIKPEYVDCVPSNLVLAGGRLHYIDREWRAAVPVSFGALLLRNVDAIHALDPTCPDVSRARLLGVLAEMGLHIDAETLREYDALVRGIVAQVYPDSGEVQAADNRIPTPDRLQSHLDGIIRAIERMAQPDPVMRRFLIHLREVLHVVNGGKGRSDHWDRLAAHGEATAEEIQLCTRTLGLLDRGGPAWQSGAETLRSIIRRLEQPPPSCAAAVVGSTVECPALSSYRRYSHGNRFKDHVCLNPFVYAEIRADGSVASCCYHAFSLGNLNDQSIAQIWNSPAAREVRRSIASGEYGYCDLGKCAAMQQVVGGMKARPSRYQIPYRLYPRTSLSDALPGLPDPMRNPAPLIVSFEDDPSCNLTCPSCRTAPLMLTPERSRAVLEVENRVLDALPAAAHEVWFSGAGDPFASAACRRLLQHYPFERFSRLGIRLDTNGTLLTGRCWDALPESVRERVRLVAVSVDAATAATYSVVRRGGDFDRLLKNLGMLSTVPERQRGLQLLIRMIVQQNNYREMVEFVKLGQSLGADHIVFSALQNWGTFSEDEYRGHAVHLPDHPEQGVLRQILKDPVFADPCVDLGNLQSLAETAPHAPRPASMSQRAKVIAFYLPQYHPIPENDLWWGKGFTEWTNVTKAKPLYEGHYQPHLPADLGFYDLRVAAVREQQAELAQKYGITAFCYWHYWFGGRRLLELPFEEVVRSGQPEFPFCLGWANQTWSGVWHGAPDRILIEQTYPGASDHAAHFQALLPAFRDPRYFRIEGRPVFLIYAPTHLPDARAFTGQWQELAAKNGLDGFHFIAHNVRDPESFGCHSCVDNAPFVSMRAAPLKFTPLNGGGMPRVYDYRSLVAYLRSYELGGREYPLVVPNWDNTPRSGANGLVLHGSTPELFREMLENALRKVEGRAAEERLVFVKAWNEWAEGNHLEPDAVHGHRYLEVIRDCIRPSGVLSGRQSGRHQTQAAA